MAFECLEVIINSVSEEGCHYAETNPVHRHTHLPQSPVSNTATTTARRRYIRRPLSIIPPNQHRQPRPRLHQQRYLPRRLGQIIPNLQTRTLHLTTGPPHNHKPLLLVTLPGSNPSLPSLLLKSLASTGFQASNLGDAIETVNQLLEWRLSHEQVIEDYNEEEKNLTYRESDRCKIFLGFTSNLVSSGV